VTGKEKRAEKYHRARIDPLRASRELHDGGDPIGELWSRKLYPGGLTKELN